MGTKDHKKSAPKSVKTGILTISSTRTLDSDESGSWIKSLITKEGHQVLVHRVIPDDKHLISAAVTDAIQDFQPEVIILTGGTGISSKDVTIEAIQPLFSKELTAFGVLFAHLSYEEIDSAAILSRATAGVVEGTILFLIPGSLKACKLACRELILPELGHLVKHTSEG